MQFRCESGWVGIVVRIELHGVPSGLAPPLPVLHDDVQRKAPGLELFGILNYLVLRVIALAAMDVSEHPFRHLRDGARESAVGRYDFVGSPCEDGIIECLRHRRTEHRLIHDLTAVNHGIVAAHSFDGNGMASDRKSHDDGRGGRQPGIGHIDDRFAVYGEIVPARHFLTHIQHQSILPCLRNVQSAGESPGPAHLTAVAGSARGVDGRHLPFIILLRKRDASSSRIEISKAIIVP